MANTRATRARALLAARGSALIAALVLATALVAGPALAQAPAPSVAAPDAPDSPAATGGSGKKARGKFKRSKLTSDESEGKADRRRVLLATGEDKAVDLDFEANGGVNGISIGNPKVVLTTLVKVGDKRQVVFKPLAAGDTTVTVRDTDGSIRLIFTVKVTGSNLLRMANEIRDLIRDVEGVDVRVVGQKVAVEGEVLVPADYGRVVAIINDEVYAKSVFNLVSLSPLAMQVLARRIQEDINAFAPNVKTRVVNGVIFLEGTVDTLEQARRSEKVASLYLPDVKPSGILERTDAGAQKIPGRRLVENFLVVNPPPAKKQEKLVRVAIHFVELSKDYNKLFAFKWEPGFTADPQIALGTNAQGGLGAGGSSFSATISSLIPKLKSAQSAGYARVLRSGTVIVRSSQAANLKDQIQLPYTSAGPNGTTTTAFQPVGFSMSVTPTILGSSEDIAMDLQMEQSAPSSRSPAGIGVSTHRVDTKVYVKSNESAAVAGVTQSNVQTNFNKQDPNAGSFAQGTDPLFSLLRSKDYLKQKSQFVIFVTPQIVESASEGSEDLKKNFRVRVK